MMELSLSSMYVSILVPNCHLFQHNSFQVNHLGPMLLTFELLPLLLDTAASSGDRRIIFVSSAGHSFAQPFDANRLNLEESDYGRFSAYNNSKLYNVLQ